MKNRGFTLIEILIVLGIIAVLMTMVILTVNPARQFAQVRNTQRWSNLNSILSAIYQNMIDNSGIFTCSAGALATSTTVMGSGTGQYNICSCLVPTYIATMPFDPSTGSYTSCSSYNSAYTVSQATSGRVSVAAPSAELGQTIDLTR